MIIENSTLKVGGNSHLELLAELVLKIGAKITAWANKMIAKYKPIIVTNPTVKLCNPFTLIISFTVNGNEKFQVVVEGNYIQQYKDKFKLNEDGNNESELIDIPENELFLIISHNQKKWFKKG